MRELSGLFFVFTLSAFFSAKIVRILIPWFWSLSSVTAHFLIPGSVAPEIDTQVYVSGILFFSVFFCLLFWIVSFARKRNNGASEYITWANYSVALYLLVVPTINIFELDRIVPLLLLGAGLVSAIFMRIAGKQWSVSLFSSLAAMVTLKFLLMPLIYYDIGPNPYVLMGDYVVIGLFAVALRFYFSKTRHFSGSIRWIVGLLSAGVLLSLLRLMTLAKYPVDIYFTILPAYQFIHGGTPLVSLMSRYGLLYLVPWVIWFTIFPSIPISFQSGVILTTLLLIIYFICLTYVVSKLITHRLIFLFTVLSSFYFTILIRYFSFPDPVSLLTAPAFTPLRFGVFIAPLYSLILYGRGRTDKHLYVFLVVSSLCFFYSFEVGIGIFTAAIVLATTHIAINKRIAWMILALFGSLISTGVMLTLLFFIRAGSMPDWGFYILQSKLYSQGFMTVPVGANTVVFFPIIVSLAASIFGLWRIIAKRDRYGYIVLYLGIMTLVQLPYYMSRSIYPTLYAVSLPFILLCGSLSGYGLVFFEKRQKDANTIGICVATLMCSFVIFVGGARAIIIIGRNMFHSFEIIQKAGEFVRKSVTHWDIQSNSSYAFLKKYLPVGCPVLIFDKHEHELITSLGAIPAYEYSIVSEFIISREQIDSLRPRVGSSNICIFVNKSFIDAPDYWVSDVYSYYWKKYGSSAKFIAEDVQKNFYIYAIPVR